MTCCSAMNDLGELPGLRTLSQSSPFSFCPAFLSVIVDPTKLYRSQRQKYRDGFNHAAKVVLARWAGPVDGNELFTMTRFSFDGAQGFRNPSKWHGFECHSCKISFIVLLMSQEPHYRCWKLRSVSIYRFHLVQLFRLRFFRLSSPLPILSRH